MSEPEKNRYRQAREKAGLTREKASDETKIALSKIERIECEKAYANPFEVCEMAKAYKDKNLYNYYCVEECEIGNKLGVPKIDYDSDDLSQITLRILSILSTVDKDKEELINITADDEISDDELENFQEIQSHLDQLETYAKSLSLYLQGILDSK